MRLAIVLLVACGTDRSFDDVLNDANRISACPEFAWPLPDDGNPNTPPVYVKQCASACEMMPPKTEIPVGAICEDGIEQGGRVVSIDGYIGTCVIDSPDLPVKWKPCVCPDAEGRHVPCEE